MNALICAIGLSCLPVLGQAWTAANYHKVEQVSENVFEVVGERGSAGQEYWCAAGDYARRVLHAKAVQRIYLVRGRAPAQSQKSRQAILFSLLPPPDAVPKKSLSLSVSEIGSNLSTSSAQRYCDYDITE